MSRPAAPASRRKHDVWPISRTGRSASSTISPDSSDVSGTSRGRDGPQPVALELVGLVGELGQVPGAGHGLGPHQRGRPDLLVQVPVAVEPVVDESPHQTGPQPPVHGEHGARHCARPGRCRGCRARCRCPSAAPSGGPDRSPGSSPTVRTTTLSSGPEPSGQSSAGMLGTNSRIRWIQSESWSASAASSSMRAPSSRLRARSPPASPARPVAMERRPTSAEMRFNLGPQVVSLARHSPPPLVVDDDLVQRRGRLAPAGHRGLDCLGIGPQLAQIEHSPTVPAHGIGAWRGAAAVLPGWRCHLPNWTFPLILRLGSGCGQSQWN